MDKEHILNEIRRTAKENGGSPLGQARFHQQTGSNIQPVSLLLLGAGFSQAGPYAPLVFAVAIPVGAIVFLARRRSILSKNAG
jgi:hypothetical protein